MGSSLEGTATCLGLDLLISTPSRWIARNFKDKPSAERYQIYVKTTMPPRKKAKEEPRREEARPSVAELDGVENPFAQLAQKHWTSKKSAKVKVKPDVLKNEIWDVLEKEGFMFKSLLVLENLQILEKCGCSLKVWRIANCSNSYLWPGYSEDSSNFHVLLIALITNVKTREHLPTWGKSFGPDTGALTNCQ